ANYAWANRQLLTHQVRKALAKVLGKPWERLGMTLVYDVAHNIAKLEEYDVEAAQFALEERMACGFGVCQACIVPNRHPPPRYRLLCTEGPVIETGKVAW
ncbi:MAG: RtcB family protein, partial [Gemmatimonadetes bacterium]|nr:RtcB family protein [Gemmatimonadota bacterium]